jgi:hypothetical protein
VQFYNLDYTSTKARAAPSKALLAILFSIVQFIMGYEIVNFLGDQDAAPETLTLPFNGNPFRLAWDDIYLFFYEFFSLPGTILPWVGKYPDDELTSNFANNYCIVIHAVLVVLQLLFIISVLLAPFIPVLPLGLFLVYFFGFIVANYYICKILLNGTAAYLESSVDKQIAGFWKDEHAKERWIFLNGVSVGQHWLQSNINRLSKTFGRHVVGVHNPTTGIVFDVIECLVQRCFCYATLDIRNAYVQVKGALEDPRYNKVIFIVHSQGAIEGSMIVDWLLDEVPRDLLYQLEVYTFGNASNHMNNPHKSPVRLNGANQPPLRSSTAKAPSIDTHIDTNGVSPAQGTSASCKEKSIGFIEHYAHAGDFVARWGVLHFTQPPAPTPANAASPSDPFINRFMGRIFIQRASGHMLNQHYLESMFTLDSVKKVGCARTNAFMEQHVSTIEKPGDVINKRTSVLDSLVDIIEDGERVERGVNMRNVGTPAEVQFPGVPRTDTGSLQYKVKDLSRLWGYRNGMIPGKAVEGLND